MVGDVLHREHAAIAVPDHDRIWKAALSHPARRVVVIRYSFGGRLERGTFGRAAVADRQDIMASTIEREAGEAKRRQRGWQEPRRTDVEIHRIAMEQHHRAGCGTAIR
jgi:hypothetical protein